jgi:hypothetical protein
MGTFLTERQRSEKRDPKADKRKVEIGKMQRANGKIAGTEEESVWDDGKGMATILRRTTLTAKYKWLSRNRHVNINTKITIQTVCIQ